MNCPNCAMRMTDWKLTGRLGNQFTIDVCPPCQAFWFNRHEDLGLSPASTLQLMKYIGDHSSSPKPAFADQLMCRLCGSSLSLAHDMTRNVHFVYWKCPSEHGRFISFLDFLQEKNFIRPLSLQEIQHLRESIQEVHCSNCGASVNLQANSACPYCHSPISILDLEEPQRMLAQLKEAAGAKPVDPALPLKLAMAKAETSNYFFVEHDSHWWDDARAGDLVQAGLNAVSRWLRKLTT
jgi:Transcription factor zinc-finger